MCFTSFRKTLLVLIAIILLLTTRTSFSAPAPFVAVIHDAQFTLPAIVFPPEANTEEKFNWEKLRSGLQTQQRYQQTNPAVNAVRYLQEAIQRMSGKTLPVVVNNNQTQGIVLTTLAHASPEIKKDAAVLQALQPLPHDNYNANEAFFVRTAPGRILIVANTVEGLGHGVVELLESVGYEVLGIGPNWTHVPDFHEKPLQFNLERTGRPGFYVRELGLTSGQGHGIGTLFQKPLPDSTDETVEVSYNRWSIGTRIVGTSMPRFPGEIMQTYHRAIVDKMKEVGSTAGFLTVARIGSDAERPPASVENNGHIWINTGPEPRAVMFVSDGKTWVKQDLQPRGVKLDLSAPLVQQIILDNLKKRAEEHFQKTFANERDRLFVFPTEPSDGAQPIEYLHNPQWYPQYLKQEGIEFGQPYVLHGFKGLNQPRELWDATAFADTAFGFNNWLLREFDKWIDSRPSAERVTKEGIPKKELLRTSLLSYNSHDVPPNFNLDPRIRVMIAGFPKHRGHGKWRGFASQADMAEAFRLMLPREPVGDYWISSISYYRDFETSGIGGSRLARTVRQRIAADYNAGFRALHMESDLNFGRMGLEYYLYAKMLWNPTQTAEELKTVRERWLQRAFGSGWQEMKSYYDFMAPENFTVNAPNNWGKAIRLIEAADAKIEGGSPEQKRLDDLKQYWYFYYLRESGQDKPTSPALREFVWKGQMSYMTAMHMVANRLFKTHDVRKAAGEEFTTSPAHYTAEETAQWWAKVLDFWQVTPVANFFEGTLINGKAARTVDVNDLVAVAQFLSPLADSPFFYNSGEQKNVAFLTRITQPGQTVGFKLFWPYNPADNNYREKSVHYGISRWDTASGNWQELIDKTMTQQESVALNDKNGKMQQVVEAKYTASEPGVYRIVVGYGGYLSQLAALNYDVATGTYGPAQNLTQGMTFFDTQAGLTQSPTYIYIPKGTKSFDLEVWGPSGAKNKKLVLQTGLPSTGMKAVRTIEVGEAGTHTISLNPGEDGTIAILQSNGFYFPFLYSVPMLWAKSPQALLVPRAVVLADGLTASP